MLTVKHYQRPLASITVGGEHARITPGVVARFSKPLSDKNVNIYAVSSGENSVSFFVDEAEADKAMLAVRDMIAAGPFEGVSVRKGIGMVSVSGPELAVTPGLVQKILSPIAKAKINMLTMTACFDSYMLFYEYVDAEKAFGILNTFIPKISAFKKARVTSGSAGKRR